MPSKNEILATTQRMANGWAAVLAFPNGGRQLFSSRHGTIETALLEAKHGLNARIKHPLGVCPDPEPNMLQILENVNNREDHGITVSNYMLEKYPNII